MINVLDYGARGDGVTDDADTFNRALLTGEAVWVPWTAGGYRVDGEIVVRGRMDNQLGRWGRLIGERGVVVAGTIRTQGWGVEVTGLTIIGGSLIMDCGTVNCYKHRYSGLRFEGSERGISSEGDGLHGGYITDTVMEDVHCVNTLGEQIYLHRSRGFILLKWINVDCTGNINDEIYGGIRIEDFNGVELDRVTVTGNPKSAVKDNGIYGIIIRGAGKERTQGRNLTVWTNRVLVDSWNGQGIRVEDVANGHIHDIMAYGCGGDGIVLKNVVDSCVDDVCVVGCKEKGSMGLTLYECERTNLSNIRVDEVDYDGIGLNKTVDCLFNNVQLGKIGHSGIKEYPGCDGNVFRNVNTNGNRISLTGKKSRVNL